jgi:hypothetical protein
LTEKQVVNGVIGRDCSSFMAPSQNTMLGILLFSFILYALALEIELSAMASRCLDRRIDTLEKLSGELKAWQSKRNDKRKLVDWQFTAEDARIKLHKLYPSL